MVKERSVQHNHATRPPAFDAELMRWLPFIRRKVSQRVSDAQKREDMVQDVLVAAMHRWQSYNPQYSMSTWLAFVVLSVSAKKKERQHDAEIDRPVPAAQEHAADLASVVRAIRPDRLELMLRVASGELMAEIAREEGRPRQAIHNRVVKERARLSRFAA